MEEEWKTLWRIVINERGENQETKSFSAAFAIRSHARILDASSLRFPVFSSVEQYYSEEEKECLEKSNDQYLPARFSLLWKSATSDIILYIRPYFYAGGKLPVNTAARSIRHLRWKYLRSLPVHLSPSPPPFRLLLIHLGGEIDWNSITGERCLPARYFLNVFLYNLSKVKRRQRLGLVVSRNVSRMRGGRKCQESNKVDQGFVYVEEKLFRKEEGKLLVEAWVEEYARGDKVSWERRHRFTRVTIFYNLLMKGGNFFVVETVSRFFLSSRISLLHILFRVVKTERRNKVRQE